MFQTFQSTNGGARLAKKEKEKFEVAAAFGSLIASLVTLFTCPEPAIMCCSRGGARRESFFLLSFDSRR